MMMPIPIQAPVVETAAQHPLSPEHLRQLDEARLRRRMIQKAVSIARFDAWTVAIFGALTLLFGFLSIAGWIMGAGMLTVAAVEFRSARGMNALQKGAARRLGWNQIALGTLLLGYAAWGVYGALFGPDPLAAVMDQDVEVAAMLEPFSSLARTIAIIVYAAIAFVAIAVQGGMAWYYFTRARHIDAYRAQTPGWIIELEATRHG